MSFFRRITHWLRGNSQRVLSSANVTLNEKLEQARHAQYAERYDEALSLLSEALSVAQAQHEATAIVDIALSRADIMIAQGDYNTATFVLNELKQECEDRQHRAPLAYALASLGIIEQKQGRFESARKLYEEARDTAQIINTDGASGRALAHLADTYLQEGNASYAIYLLEDALPRLIRSGDKELVGYFQGIYGDALFASGQPQEGMDELKKGLESALVLKHQVQQREINQKIGIYALQLADYQKSIVHLRDAFRLYDKESPSSEFIVLLCHLSRATYKAEKTQESLDYAGQAISLLDQIDDENLSAMATSALGLALSLSGKSDEALPHLEAAEIAYSDLETDAFYMDILQNLARAQFESGDTDSAKQTYAKALDKGRSLPLQKGQIYSDLARLETKLKNYKGAIQYYHDSVQAYSQSNHRNFMAWSYCAIGKLYMQIGDGKMARREYEQSLVQLNNMEDVSTRGRILAEVAIAYTEFGDIDSAEAFYKESIEIAKRESNKSEEAKRRGAYGYFLNIVNKPKRAITEIMQAHNYFNEAGQIPAAGIQLGYLGLAYATLGNHEKAIENYDDALEKLGDKPESALVRVHKADSLLAMGSVDDAKSAYELALQIARDDDNRTTMLEALIGLAGVEVEAHNLDKAKDYLAESEMIIRVGNLRRIQANFYDVQSRYFSAVGDNTKAQSAWEESSKLRSMLGMPEKTSDWL